MDVLCQLFEHLSGGILYHMLEGLCGDMVSHAGRPVGCVLFHLLEAV